MRSIFAYFFPLKSKFESGVSHSFIYIACKFFVYKRFKSFLKRKCAGLRLGMRRMLVGNALFNEGNAHIV